MKKIDCALALKLLKNDYVLESFDKTNHYIFVLEKGKILVKSQKYSVFVDFLEFLSIYKDFNFNLIETKNEDYSIDLTKDKDFYERLQKKQ